MNINKVIFVRTTRPAAEALRRWRARNKPRIVKLDSVRHRLELFLAAMYGRTIRIEHANPPRKSNWLERIVSGTPHHLRTRDSLSESNDESISLPSELHDVNGGYTAVDQYRLLAIEHAERITRGTAAWVPGADTPLERDLYLLAEAATIDTTIAHSVGGIVPMLLAARSTALARRPAPSALTPIEREVESITRQVLTSRPTDTVKEVGPFTTPADSLAWAHTTAARLRTASHGPRDRYRGITPVGLWGTIRAKIKISSAPTAEQAMEDALNAAPMFDTGVEQMSGAGPRNSGNHADESQLAPESEDTDNSGSDVEDPAGVPMRTTGGDDPALSEHASDDVTDAPMGASMDAAVIQSPPQRDAAPECTTTNYPEWDCNAGQYRARGVTVRECTAIETSPIWSTDVLSAHSVLIRRVRQQFERLSAQRTRLMRQHEGDELDISACVRALVDRSMGQAADDRLYTSVRPARRAIAIALLVDVSGSTNMPVVDGRRIVDVEKTALLLASEALDALGDRYAIFTFSGVGARDVRLTAMKDFTERNGDAVHRRISAIEPHGNTRLGAAVRHTAALLGRQSAGHRLLLILSDGKPNDTDRYFEQYAVEDTRRAILEARTQGVHPFCLTVDAEEPEEYLSHIFGPTGHTILRRPDQLPLALLQGTRQLLGY